VSILGIDLGSRRIGIAVSDSGVVATPHSVLRNEGDVVAKLATLGQQLEAEEFVVGIPRRAHASVHETANIQKYRDFAEKLRQKTCKPVVLWDEALSTVEAMDRLRASGKHRRKRRKTSTCTPPRSSSSPISTTPHGGRQHAALSWRLPRSCDR
jgi:putative transcription antitermination factor YqgF